MAPPKPTKAQKKPRTSSSSQINPFPLRIDSPEDGPPLKKPRTKPLISIARPPIFDLTGSDFSDPLQPTKDTKGKGKERAAGQVTVENRACDQLWIDKYEPQTEEDLAVHKKKVQDVRQWLLEAFNGGPSGKLKKYRRILALTGPAGTAKTAVIRVLARELGAEIVEWRNTTDEKFSRGDDFGSAWGDRDGLEYEGLSEKFQSFLTRASTCRSVFSPNPSTTSKPPSSTSSSASPSQKRQIVLLEDLPNILHANTQTSFHAALEGFVDSQDAAVAPLVIIISDTGLRGEDTEDGGNHWRSRGKETMDVRNVLPPSLLHSPYATQISFNPIATTYMRAALKRMLDTHFMVSHASRPTKEVVDLIAESSNGDIRSAVMALQFACTAERSPSIGTKGKQPAKKGKATKGPSARVLMEAVTRREQSLALFHLIGKVLYNKRKGDPPVSSASAKDIRRDKELDAQLKDPPRLASYLQEHERRTSRVDIETLYTDSPIDGSLLALYIHQNYTQYCDTLDQCDALVDSLSWVDASGGETWHQANPHQFHLVVLGTLHALPSPVPRRGQKPFKPAFFDTLQRTHAAADGARDAQAWLHRHGIPGWSERDIVLGVGGVIRARERGLQNASQRDMRDAVPPPSHRAFSALEFTRDSGAGLSQLAEGEDADAYGETRFDAQDRAPRGEAEDAPAVEERAWWLDEDDIEDFDD